MNRAISNPTDLGLLVREARKSLGLSQDVLAAVAGVGPRFVTELEAGKQTVQLDKVFAVLATLGIQLQADLPGA